MRRSEPSQASAFISYRSDDSPDVARQLAGELKRDLGLDEVYFAPTDNVPLDKWPLRLETALARSSLVVVLIGPNWLGCGQDGTHRRCVHHEGDWVRREVLHGLGEDAVLSVLVDRRRAPDPDELPADLHPLLDVHGVTLRRGDPYGPAYQAILTACWRAFRRQVRAQVVVVTDDRDRAHAQLDELLQLLDTQDLAEARLASRTITDPRGLAAISLSDAAQRWPDVIILADELTPTLLARVRALRETRTTERVALVVVGAGLAIVGNRLTSGHEDANASHLVDDLQDHLDAMDASLFASGDELVRWMRAGTGGASTWSRLAKGAGIAAVVAAVAVVLLLLVQPGAGLAVDAIDFGPGIVVDDEVVATTTVRNDSDEAATILALEVDDPMLAFATSGCVGETLEPGDRCTLDIQTVPTVVGVHEGELGIRYQLDGGSIEEAAAPWSLVVLATTVGQLQLSPTPVDFGELMVGTEGQRDVTVANVGDGPAVVDAVVGPSDPFVVDGDDCEGRRLQPGEACTLQVGVRLVEPGAATPGTIEIQFRSAGEGFTVETVALASGIEPSDGPATPPVEPSTAPALTSGPSTTDPTTPPTRGVGRFDPPEVDLGQALVGTAANQIVELTNTGDGPLAVEGLDLVDPTGSFAVDHRRCGDTLDPGGRCAITVTATPSQAGDAPAVVTLDPRGNPPVQFTTTVEGIAPDLFVDDDGEIIVTIGGSAVTLSIQNVGSAPLRVDVPTMDASSDLDVASDNCPEVQPGAECELSIAWGSAEVGAIELPMVSNDPGSPDALAVEVRAPVITID